MLRRVRVDGERKEVWSVNYDVPNVNGPKTWKRCMMRGICNMRGLHAILLCFACVALADWAIASSEYIVKNGDTLWGIA